MTETKNECVGSMEAQEEYCKRTNSDFFAPRRNCWSCKRNIWEKITKEKASKELITGCPFCNRSYVD